jgi:hypothetical protein
LAPEPAIQSPHRTPFGENKGGTEGKIKNEFKIATPLSPVLF